MSSIVYLLRRRDNRDANGRTAVLLDEMVFAYGSLGRDTPLNTPASGC